VAKLPTTIPILTNICAQNADGEGKYPQFTPDIFNGYLELQRERERLMEKLEKGNNDNQGQDMPFKGSYYSRLGF